MNSSFFSRTKVLSLFILLFACVLITKLFLVQVVNKNTYADRADRQYVTPSSNIFERGTIFFQSKDGTLVSAGTQTTGYKVAIVPAKITDAKSLYEKLSAIIEIDEAEYNTKVDRKADPYEEIATHLSKAEADAISALKISGLSIHKEKWRFYPGHNLASHSLGIVGYNGDELGGRYGIEKKYNDVLTRNVDTPYVNFFAEVFGNIKNSLDSDIVREGDVVTSLEPAVQSFLEKQLLAVKEKYNADSIGGIIMDPSDGSIYAMAVKPDFDPNDFSKVKNASTFGNPLVEGVLEFGSVVKPLVMAGALDAGVVTANTKYNDIGTVVVEKKTIKNFDNKGRGEGTTMQEVLSQSLNTGMVFTYQKLGKERMHDYMLSYGIKERSGIDLPNETSGLVKNLTSNLKNKREIEYANASFGQGIALTPVELIRALSALGNGGNLVTPHVVEKIKYSDGTEKKINYDTTRTKISEATSEEITRMLVGVMDHYLLNKNAKLQNYSIAGKTGTAQVADNVRGGYYEDRNTHSYFGYFPAYEPKFIVLLYAVNPKGSTYASVTWTDPFLDITKFLLNYYEVPPDR